MKHLKKYNESSDVIKSDNIFYFENPDIKSVIEDTLSNVKDLLSSYKISRGFITTYPGDEPYFAYEEYTNLKNNAITQGINVYECYKVLFYNEEAGDMIEFDGDQYSSNIEFLTTILPELKDSISKLNNIEGIDVSFNLSSDIVDLLVYVPFNK
jgi:hypothetical protein